MRAEQELFTIDYPDRDPQTVWDALKRALSTMELEAPDEGTRTARFRTGVSLTSWGENMLASVDLASDGGARVTVRGRAKGSFLTTKWGEDIHAKGVEKDLRASIDDALVQAAP
ncbi:MAG: HPF/RaiA family ribosome-associated protein [Nocardioidaceae bacterium]|nr:HPF/RaiA family ribosome-associated protein [Nocardioidaceae bacterium]